MVKITYIFFCKFCDFRLYICLWAIDLIFVAQNSKVLIEDMFFFISF